MKIYFWSYRQLILMGVMVLVLFGAGVVTRDWLRPEAEVTGEQVVAQPIYQGNKEEQKMALTVNVDWGEEYIPGMLNALDAYEAKATFFITGRWAKKYPELTKEIATRGHEIGNHGYSHPHPDQISVEKNQQEILATEKEIEQSTKMKTTLFAPPYGEHGANVLKAADSLGYKVILWTVDTVDWDQSRSAEMIYGKVVEKAENGAIVLMHPTDRTLKALPSILQELKKKGYHLVTVSEVLR
ncbi:MAG: polysaccharide deacetylase family protein [Clostridia bacterium]|nr:polysaccharide deacetylase family protein [Clostridia bacterium]